jgi:hypothetical protein
MLGYRTRWGCRLTHSPRTTPRRCRRGSDAIKRARSARRDRRCHHKAFRRAARAKRTRPGVARTAAGRFLRARRRFTVGNRMNRCAPACAIACNATVIPTSAMAAPGRGAKVLHLLSACTIADIRYIMLCGRSTEAAVHAIDLPTVCVPNPERTQLWLMLRHAGWQKWLALN